MNQHDDEANAEVEALLGQAQHQSPDVPATLMARVLADAEKIRLDRVRAPLQDRAPKAWWSDLFGGWQSVGGLVAATCAGVWIGVSPPDTLPDAGAFLLGYETTDVTSTTAELTSFGWDLEEG